MNCPACKSEALHVIYYGLPMWLCEDEDCSTLFGFWSNFVTWLPFNGFFFVFEGAYIPALWAWLTQSELEE